MKYPILVLLKSDKNIYAAEKSDVEYCIINLINIYEDSIFIDSNYNLYEIKRAIKKSWAYLFGYHPFLKGRTAKIEFEINDVKKLSLKDIQEILLEKLDKGVEKGFWYKNKDIPKLKTRVMSAKTINEIIKIFSEDLY